MATNLAGDDCIGNYDVCWIRVGRLDPATCAPEYGADNGVITSALITHTSSPELNEPEPVEPENGCGDIAYSIRKQPKVKTRTITGSMIFYDFELFEIMFGGWVTLGAVGTNGAGQVVGWQEPSFDADDRAPCSLEIISRVAGQAQGACAPTASDRHLFQGIVYPKCYFNQGDVEWGVGAHVVNFSGFTEPNPNYGSGPFRDYDNNHATPARADAISFYTAYDAESDFLNGLSGPRCGYQDTPAAS